MPKLIFYPTKSGRLGRCNFGDNIIGPQAGNKYSSQIEGRTTMQNRDEVRLRTLKKNTIQTPGEEYPTDAHGIEERAQQSRGHRARMRE